MTDLTIKRLVTVVNVLIQYPHKKIKSHAELWCGEEVENYGGNDPVVRNDRHVKGEKRVKQMPRVAFDEREQFIISRGTDAGESRSRVGAGTEVG